MSEQARLEDISKTDPDLREKTGENYERKEAGFVYIPKDWEVEKVRNVADPEQEDAFIDGDWVESADMDEDGNIQLVQLGHLGEGRFKGEPDRFVNEEFAEKEGCTILEEKELMISRMQEPILRACLLPKFEQESIMAVDIARLRPKNDWNKHFLKFLFNSRPVWKQGLAWASGTTRKRISRTNLGKIELQKPPITEQRRIGSVLYNVDQAIQKTEKIIEQTKQIKKGLMQELFTEGYYEHEEFEEHSILGKYPASWEIKQVKEIGEVNSDSFSAEDFNNEKFDYITLSNVSEGRILKAKEVPTDQAPSRAKRKVRAGDILIGTVRPRQRSHARVSEEYDGDICSTGFTVIRPERMNSDYLSQVIFTHRFFSQMQAYVAGSGYPAVKNSDVKKIRIAVPPKEEQDEIAEVLKNYGTKIETLEEKKEHLQRLKRGLMQELLTGKVRTKDKDIEVLDEVLEVEK